MFEGTLSWLLFPLQCPSCMDLPLKSWYPFDVKPFPIYEIVYILQGFGQTFVGIGESFYELQTWNLIVDTNAQV